MIVETCYDSPQILHTSSPTPLYTWSVSTNLQAVAPQTLAAGPVFGSLPPRAISRGCPPLPQLLTCDYTISVIVVSFNTRELLRECLQSILAEANLLPAGATLEVLVVDNASSDGSAQMVEDEFGDLLCPVHLLRSKINLGIASANNLAMQAARGRYLVLLNSDANFHRGALRLALQNMDANTTVAMGGARLVSPGGEGQPSARSFPGLWHTFLVRSGLAARFPKTRIFGAPGRTWANPESQADIDCVPGAFSILRREALAQTGLFDPQFFLYFEEIDLCRRIKTAGLRVVYWPDVVVTHIGGASSSQLSMMQFSDHQAQPELWRMQSTLLYFRKHHGIRVWLIRAMEDAMHRLYWLRNRNSSDPARRLRAEEARLSLPLMRQAWTNTRGGRITPPQPW
jgi:GT2 family glycosyltransferase